MLNAIEEFCEIARLTESELFAVCGQKLRAAGYTALYQSRDAAGNPNQDFLFALPPDPKGLGSCIGLVAHLDIVGKAPPRKFTTDNGFIRAIHTGKGKKGQPRILGADDRAGVFAIFRLLDSGYRPAVYFTTGEETGLIGAKALAGVEGCPDYLRLLIEMDRQSWNDFTTYQCDSTELDNYCKSFGYAKVTGSSSDIRALMPAWEIGGVNLSIGYNGQHTPDEHLVMPHCLHTVYRVGEMLSNPPPKRIKFAEKTQYVSQNTFYGGYSGDNYRYKTHREIGDCIWIHPKNLPSNNINVEADHTQPSVRCVWTGIEWQQCSYKDTNNGDKRTFSDGVYTYQNATWYKDVQTTPPPGIAWNNAAPGSTKGETRMLRADKSRVTSRHIWTGFRWQESLYPSGDARILENAATLAEGKKLANTVYTPSQLLDGMNARDTTTLAPDNGPCVLCGDKLYVGDDLRRSICCWCVKDIKIKLGSYPPPAGQVVTRGGKTVSFDLPTENSTTTSDTTELDLASMDLDQLFNID